MQSTDTYLGLLQERGKRGLPLERVYRQLYNKNLYLTAYGKIYQICTAFMAKQTGSGLLRHGKFLQRIRRSKQNTGGCGTEREYRLWKDFVILFHNVVL
jgi:hypothetical protein